MSAGSDCDFPIRFQSHSIKETLAWAHRFAQTLTPHSVVAFHGELGQGKTTLIQGIIRALMNQPELIVASPTFTLMQVYQTPHFQITHCDFYRLSSTLELAEVGFYEAIESGAVLLEWPLPGTLPDHALILDLHRQDETLTITSRPHKSDK